MNKQNIRPTANQLKVGRECGWSGEELERGYGVFQDSDNEPEYIARIDDMGTFESDEEAAKQATKDGYQLLSRSFVGHEVAEQYGLLTCNWLDTPHNRLLVSKYKDIGFTEWCPDCENESDYTEKELIKIQETHVCVCKHCGKTILACALCDTNEVNCSKCPFEKNLKEAIKND